jgi:hypothetical protein
LKTKLTNQKKHKAMKTIIYAMVLLLVSASLQVNSQTALLSSINSNEQKITHVKAIESKYVDGKVYLHITVNGNTENQVLAVERSLDAKNYTVRGYITINGNNAQFDLAYYFTDESPVTANLYYRLSGNSLYNEQVYSETVSVTPIDENKAPSDIIITTPNTASIPSSIITPICDEQTNTLLVGTK